MGVSLSIDLRDNGQDINTNSSNVTAVLTLSWNSGSWNNNKKYGELYIDGDAYGFNANFNWNGSSSSGSVELIRKTVDVQHAADGTKTLECSAWYESGTSSGTVEAYKKMVLPTIPRGCALTDAENFTDEGNPKITYSNPAGNGANALQACIASKDGQTVYAPYRSIPKTGTVYTFQLTEAERNSLRNAIPNTSSMTVKFILKCTIGTQNYYGEKEKTFKVINANPIFNASVTEENSVVAGLTGNPNKLIRYVSNARAASGAAAVKGSSLAAQEIKNGGRAIQTGTGTFQAVESGEFLFSAEDSRGNTNSYTLKKEIVEYIKLTCNIGANAPDTDGNFLFQVSGNYFNDTFGAVRNTLRVEYRYKIANGVYTGWIAMSPTVIGNTYKASAAFSGLDYQTIYTFQARATDRIGTVTTQETPLQSTPVFDWGADDFKVNGNFRARKDSQFDGSVNIDGTLSINGKPFNPYPVGSIYISADSTSPASIFGGTWERLKDRFLLGSGNIYANGAVGGEASHTLTIPEIPSHKHDMKSPGANYNLKNSAVVGWGGETDYWPIAYDPNQGNDAFINDSGGGGSHNNMPPYLAVCMWKRIS